MPRIDILETIKAIDLSEEIWEWLDLFGDALGLAQSEAKYRDKMFIADTPYRKLLLFTVNKDLTTLNTIYILLRCECIHQAASHVRLLCESLITLKYISFDQEKRAELFWGYSDIEAYRITSSLLEWERNSAKEEHVTNVEKVFLTIEDKYEKIKSNYTFSTKNGKEKPFINWCNCSVYKQAAECGSEFEKLYELVYRQMSSYIHGSAWSLRKQISYSRAHYDPTVILNDVATIVRTILFVLLEWAKLLKLELGWEIYDNLTNLPKKIDELDDKHFPSR